MNSEQEARRLSDQAKALEQTYRFREAALLYRQSYDLHPAAFTACRYLHCLRKQGTRQARDAVQFARQPLRQWPHDEALVREYAWAIYDGYLRHLAAGENEEESPGFQRMLSSAGFPIMLQAARHILDVTREELPRRLAVFAICKEARSRGEWDLVLDFARSLDGEQLSPGGKATPGHSAVSDQQRWFHLVARAHLELGQHEECIAITRRASQAFPHDMFFQWWRALAHVRSGNAEEGLRELLQATRRFPTQWQIQRDIAEVYQRLEKPEDAWRWFCEAASAPGDLRSRIPMLAEMAQLLARLQRGSLAYDHLRLAWALAGREAGWERLADKHRQLALEFAGRHPQPRDAPGDSPAAAPEPGPLLDRCRTAWTEAIRQALPHGTGWIHMFDAEKGCGLIGSEEGAELFFGRSSFQGHGQEPFVGMKVKFYLKEAPGRQKDPASLIVVHVFPA